MNADALLKELVETYGLTYMLGGLVKVVGNQTAVVKEDATVDAVERLRVMTVTRILTHCRSP